MLCARIHRFGAASVIQLDQVDRPEPGPGEVLLRVAATSFNPTELALRSGMLREYFPVELPAVLGWDVAGTVAETGEGVQAFAVGDRLVGRLDGGAAAEYVAAPAELLVRAPETVPLAHAATVPVAGLTAWQAVFDHARVAPGERVLINGAGGGVGMFAVQLAKHAGAEVIATASPRSTDAVRRYGADQLVDYTTTRLPDAVQPVDVVLNLVVIDEGTAAVLIALTRPDGRLVTVASPISPPPGTGVTAWHMVARNDTADLAALIKLIDDGTVRLEVSQTYALADLALLHRRAEAGRTRGKVLVLP